ncbi:hypothetical protein E2C01_043946 [Portunus trituberculatus]|uniref:Uncharacterized protein n=1 Tax=Portunus trituberculatus TaxID=210409 RepID=A0A5B7G0W1_PORTR|nr:hypothetical protein [Portunus trituberculatus]
MLKRLERPTAAYILPLNVSSPPHRHANHPRHLQQRRSNSSFTSVVCSNFDTHLASSTLSALPVPDVLLAVPPSRPPHHSRYLTLLYVAPLALHSPENVTITGSGKKLKESFTGREVTDVRQEGREDARERQKRRKENCRGSSSRPAGIRRNRHHKADVREGLREGRGGNGGEVEGGVQSHAAGLSSTRLWLQASANTISLQLMSSEAYDQSTFSWTPRTHLTLLAPEEEEEEEEEEKERGERR